MTENMNEEILLTKEGYDKIVAEHEELVSVKRAEVVERMAIFPRTPNTILPRMSRPSWRNASTSWRR